MPVYIVRNYVELRELKTEWNELAASRGVPLLSHDWFFACARALHDEQDLHVVVVRTDDGTLGAVAPLVSTKSGGVRRLQMLGVERLGEPTGFVYRDEPSLRALYEAIEHQGRPVALSRYWHAPMPCDDFERRNAGRGYWIRRRSHGSGVLRVDSDWPGFLTTLSSKRRYDYRRANRRAEAHGGPGYSVVPGDDAAFPAALELAFDIEASSWKGRAGSSLRGNDDLGTFVRLFCDSDAGRRTLRLFLLALGDRPAAMALAAQSRDALWFIKIGYDEKFRDCSPGLLVLFEAFRHCVRSGLERIEHLGSHESWLSPWTSYVRPYSTSIYYPFNLSGALAVSGDALRFGTARAGARSEQ